MPFVERDGCRLYWRADGAEENPVLVVLNSIGTDMELWRLVLPNLTSAFRVVRMDMRGHGASDAPDVDYTLELLAGDVVAVMEAAGVTQAALAGVSLGGMVAMQLALDHPERVRSLALICTSAQMDPAAWSARVSKVRAEGTAAIADMAVGRFLSADFAATHPTVAADLKSGIVAQADAGYAGAGAAIRDMKLADRIGEIVVPTVVITGNGDVSTPYEGHGDKLLEAIPSARHVELRSGHLPPIEAPGTLAAILRNMLLPATEVDEAKQTLFDAGLCCKDWRQSEVGCRSAPIRRLLRNGG